MAPVSSNSDISFLSNRFPIFPKKIYFLYILGNRFSYDKIISLLTFYVNILFLSLFIEKCYSLWHNEFKGIVIAYLSWRKIYEKEKSIH